MLCLVKHPSLAIQRSRGREDVPGARTNTHRAGRGSGWRDARETEKEAGKEFQAASAARPAERILLSSPAERVGGAPGPALPARGGGEGAARSSRSASGCGCCGPARQRQTALSHRPLCTLRPSRRERAAGGQPGRGTARLLQPRELLLLLSLVRPAAAGDTPIPA